ncbi:energy transducer TonB family protein [Marinifilum sp. RC60d5]|uniref:energy transducer TonB family protein n=1 Tax=Marinifilum sp. RC60d5 TaxID=3458414 RepID=UPI004035E9C1
MNSIKDTIKAIITQILQFGKYIVSEYKSFVSRNKYGIMGTLAFHMLLLIILLSFKLNTKREFSEPEIFIDIPAEVAEQILKEEEEKIEKALEEKNSEISKSVDELLKSIAVNQNVKKSKSDPKVKVENMIDEIRKNLEEYGSDEAPGGKKSSNDYKLDSITAAEAKEKQRALDSLQSIEYSGPSSVYYSLEGRHKIYLPIPVFKCEGEGKIVVQITVNRSGKVIDAKVLEKESGVKDECLFEAAIGASYKTKFNVSSSSPIQQKGSITYHFVRQ